jgi:hypothetical protein
MEIGGDWAAANRAKLPGNKTRARERRLSISPPATGTFFQISARPSEATHPSPRISNLNFLYESSGVRLHLYLCGFERDEAAAEVNTHWVTNKIGPFNSRFMLP